MNIIKDFPELIQAGIITQETADKILAYYHSKEGKSPNKLYIIFGILGALLIGLGIILIVAHNWDELSKTSKTFFAFLPLVAGQVCCSFVLLKKQDNIAWRESAAAFLFLATGAGISLISQIYNMSGDLNTFLLTWMLLCLPLIYIMKSSVASLLYLTGITYYAVNIGYWTYSSSESYYYWLLLLAALPYYYFLYKKNPESNFIIIHNWIISLSIVIILGTVARKKEELMFVAYISLFGLFYLTGNNFFHKKLKAGNNPFLILGSLGTISLLLALSFDWFWDKLRNTKFQVNELIASPEFFAAALLSILAAVLFYFQKRKKSFKDIKPIEPVFMLFIVIFIIGLSSSLSIVLINLLIFTIGLLTIRNGVKVNHLGILNYGLLIIMALVVCKFFDTDLSFITRGILFMSVGIGFFIANYLMLKKRKENG